MLGLTGLAVSGCAVVSPGPVEVEPVAVMTPVAPAAVVVTAPVVVETVPSVVVVPGQTYYRQPTSVRRDRPVQHVTPMPRPPVPPQHTNVHRPQPQPQPVQPQRRPQQTH